MKSYAEILIHAQLARIVPHQSQIGTVYDLTVKLKHSTVRTSDKNLINAIATLCFSLVMATYQQSSEIRVFSSSENNQHVTHVFSLKNSSKIISSLLAN